MRPQSRALPGALLSGAIPVVAVALGLASLSTAKMSAIGPYGLIQALPLGYFVALAVLSASFLVTWSRPRLSRVQFVIEAVGLVVLLQGAPAIVEPQARFATAWLHAGFTGYVAQTGKVLPLLDARFSWPAFFSGTAMLARAAGLPNTVVLLKWWPVAVNLLYLPPLFLLARRLLGDERRAMLVVWLFPLANWVGQDYFSPQSLALLLYLTLIYVVVAKFSERRPLLLTWRLGAQAGLDEVAPADSTQHVIVNLSILLVLDCAMIMGHQLTPIFAVVAVALLVIFGRSRLRAFPVLMFVLTAGWICYGAVAFWSGHPDALFGGLGHLSGNVSADLTGRLRGSPAHYAVLDVRLLVTALVWLLAVVGLVVGRRMGAERRTALILMAAPFFVLAAQSYGGEAGLRVYLFALPGALCLIVLALTRTAPALRVVLAGLLIALLIPGFLVARWGNELSEMTRPAELAGVQALYRLAPRGSTLMSITPQITWRYTDAAGYNYEPDNLDEFAFKNVSAIEKRVAANAAGGFVIITTSQLTYGEQAYGLPSDWGPQVEAALTQSGRFRLVYENSDTHIYRYVGGS